MDSIAEFISQKDEIEKLKSQVESLTAENKRIISTHGKAGVKAEKHLSIAFLIGIDMSMAAIASELGVSTALVARIKKIVCA